MLKIKNRLDLRMIIFSILMIFLSFSKPYSDELKVGVSYAPPYYNVDEKTVTGSLADLMKKIVSEAGYALTWKATSTDKIYSGIAQGEIDVYLGPITPNFKDFDELVIHSELSPVTLELRCYYFGNHPPITKKDELTGKKVLIIRGYTYGGLVNYILDPANNIEYTEIESIDQAVRMLKNRGFDYHLNYKKTVELYLERNIEENLNYSILSNVNLYFMVSKKTPNAEDILMKIENSFLKIKEKQQE